MFLIWRIVACWWLQTIAFGMGMIKPECYGFVIHHDIPKKYRKPIDQETGRAGRDGVRGHCLAFFTFPIRIVGEETGKISCQEKPVAEQGKFGKCT